MSLGRRGGRGLVPFRGQDHPGGAVQVVEGILGYIGHIISHGLGEREDKGEGWTCRGHPGLVRGQGWMGMGP